MSSSLYLLHHSQAEVISTRKAVSSIFVLFILARSWQPFVALTHALSSCCSWDSHWWPQRLDWDWTAVPGTLPGPASPLMWTVGLRWLTLASAWPPSSFLRFWFVLGHRLPWNWGGPWISQDRYTWQADMVRATKTKHKPWQTFPVIPEHLQSSCFTVQVKLFPVVFLLQVFCFRPEMAFLRTWKHRSLINWIELWISWSGRVLSILCL